jgi:hypothetical protein
MGGARHAHTCPTRMSGRGATRVWGEVTVRTQPGSVICRRVTVRYCVCTVPVGRRRGEVRLCPLRGARSHRRTRPMADGSPGPGEQKEGGHQQTRLPIRPSCMSGLDGGCPAPLPPGMPRRQTMAPLCQIRLPRWPRCPFIRSNTCDKGFWTVPMPCWLKRAQLLVAARSSRRPTKVGSRDREVARGPAFGVGLACR